MLDFKLCSIVYLICHQSVIDSRLEEEATLNVNENMFMCITDLTYQFVS
jgi:hypothetical protein